MLQAKSLSPVVVSQAVLAAPRFGRELEGTGIEGEVAAAEVEGGRIRVKWGGDIAAVGAGGAVDPVVEAPAEAVQHGLHVELVGAVRGVVAGEPGKHHFSRVGFAIAVGVFEVENVGGGGHKDPAVPAEHAGGPREIVGVNGAAVEAAIAVGVFEQAHATEVRLGVAEFGVIDHFDDEQASVLVEADFNGIANEGFGGDEFDAETGAQFEGLEDAIEFDGLDPGQLAGNRGGRVGGGGKEIKGGGPTGENDSRPQGPCVAHDISLTGRSVGEKL